MTDIREQLEDLYVDVLGAYSPRRGAQYVAALLFQLDTGDTAHGLDHSAFAKYEEALHHRLSTIVAERGADGYDGGVLKDIV